jgi:hypothetical protein
VSEIKKNNTGGDKSKEEKVILTGTRISTEVSIIGFDYIRSLKNEVKTPLACLLLPLT